MNWLEKFLSLIRPGSRNQVPGESPAPFDAEKRMVGLMQMLIVTQEDELGCEEVFQLLDQYAEAIELGGDPQLSMPLVSQHLEICQECEEELQAVLEILRSIRSAQRS